MIVTRQVITENRQLLIIQGNLVAQNKIEAAVDVYFKSKAHLTMKNVTKESCEFVYTISEGLLKKAKEKNIISIDQKLMELEGVNNVNLVEQLDDIGR